MKKLLDLLRIACAEFYRKCNYREEENRKLFFHRLTVKTKMKEIALVFIYTDIYIFHCRVVQMQLPLPSDVRHHR